MEERKVYYASGLAPRYLQKWHQPGLRVVGVFISSKAAASKLGVQKQTWQLAVQGYNRSCQHTWGQRPSAVSGGLSKGEGLYSSLILSPALISLWVSLSFPPLLHHNREVI
jgi:hypothetical protein